MKPMSLLFFVPLVMFHSATAQTTGVRLDPYGDRLPRHALTRFGTVRLKHSQSVLGVTWSPDGGRLVSCGWDGIRIWNSATGKPIGSLNVRPGRGCFGAAFSPDGAKLATVHENGYVRLWTFPRFEELLVQQAHKGRTFGVAFAPNGQTFATAGGDSMVRLWSVGQAKSIREFAIQERLRDSFALAFSRDGKHIAAGALKTLYVWDVATGEKKQQIQNAHGRDVISVAFSADGDSVASSGQSNFRRVTMDGKTIATADSQVRVWDIKTGKQIGSFEGRQLDQGTCAIALSTDGDTLVAAHRERIRLWDFIKRKPIRDWPVQSSSMYRSHGTALSPDGTRLATIGGEHDVRIYDTSTGKRILAPPNQHLEAITCLDISSDGKLVATGSMDGVVIVREVKTGKVVANFEFSDRNSGVNDIAFPSDGRTVYCGGWVSNPGFEIGGKISAWDLVNAKPVWAQGVKDRVGAVSTIDDTTLALGVGLDYFRNESKPYVSLRSATTGKETGQLEARMELKGFRKSDGRTLVAYDTRGLVEWDLETRKQIRALDMKGHDRPSLYNVAGSPTEPTLATSGDFDPLVLVRNQSNGSVRRKIKIADSFANQLAYSPDGRFLAAASLLKKIDRRRGSQIRVFDVQTGKPISLFLPGHRRSQAIRFTPDGMRLLTAHGDGTVLVWDTSDLGE